MISAIAGIVFVLLFMTWILSRNKCSVCGKRTWFVDPVVHYLKKHDKTSFMYEGEK